MKKLLLKLLTKKAIGKLTGSGMIKPLPGSGIVDEISETIGEIKKNNNYKRLFKMGAYIITMVVMWYLISKGVEVTVLETIIGLVKLLLG